GDSVTVLGTHGQSGIEVVGIGRCGDLATATLNDVPRGSSGGVPSEVDLVGAGGTGGEVLWRRRCAWYVLREDQRAVGTDRDRSRVDAHGGGKGSKIAVVRTVFDPVTVELRV